MARICNVYALLAVASMFTCVLSSIVERYRAELSDGVQEGDKLMISCMCENGTDVSKQLDQELAVALVKGEFSETDCQMISEARDVCLLLAFCSGCAVRRLKCRPTDAAAEKPYCLNEIYLLNDNYFGLQDSQLKDIIRTERVRVKRRADVCTYPSSMKTADVVCQTLGNKVTCSQACIFGHTLKEGVMRTMECNKKDNVWRPTGFTECDPFVDCSLSLKSPGSVDCFSGTTRTAPLCYVSCSHYEDEPAIPRRAYECTPTGSWNRQLPFCVNPGSGLLLVKKPSNFAVNQDYS